MRDPKPVPSFLCGFDAPPGTPAAARAREGALEWGTATSGHGPEERALAPLP